MPDRILVWGAGAIGGSVGAWLRRAGHDVTLFELRKEIRRKHVGEQVAGTDIDPRVFVDLSAKELAAIRSLFANNLSTLGQRRIIDDERAALAATDILRLMKALRRQRRE